MSSAWQNDSAQIVSSVKATHPSTRPILVRALQLSTAGVSEGTLTEQGSENKPKLPSISNFNKEYRIHCTLFFYRLQGVPMPGHLYTFKHTNQNKSIRETKFVSCCNLWERFFHNHQTFPKSESLYALPKYWIRGIYEKILDYFQGNNMQVPPTRQHLGYLVSTFKHGAKFLHSTVNTTELCHVL